MYIDVGINSFSYNYHIRMKIEATTKYVKHQFKKKWNDKFLASIKKKLNSLTQSRTEMFAAEYSESLFTNRIKITI